jgi:hypothetical protein
MDQQVLIFHQEARHNFLRSAKSLECAALLPETNRIILPAEWIGSDR